MNHIAFGVPVLILAIAEYLDKLLENCGLAAVASLRKSCGVVIMTIDSSFMLVVVIFRTKGGGTH